MQQQTVFKPKVDKQVHTLLGFDRKTPEIRLTIPKETETEFVYMTALIVKVWLQTVMS